MLTKQGYGCECDWWGLGVVLFECLCGFAPFYAGNAKQTCRNIVNYSRSLIVPADAELSEHAKDCILKLLCSWQSRMDFAALQKHAFMKGVDWLNLQHMAPPHPSAGVDSGAMPDMPESGPLHYTMSADAMGIVTPTPASRQRKCSRQSRMHFKGFSFDGESNIKQ